jgi:hypothetical protein
VPNGAAVPWTSTIPNASTIAVVAASTPAGSNPSRRYQGSSAGNVRRGHISKQGSRWVRWVMVEAATHALRDPELRQFFLCIAKRRGVKIARVAVARRLLTLAFHALGSDTCCRSYPLGKPSVEARSFAVMASR